MSDVNEAIRRDMREQWRAEHPASRRPIRSFMTADDKRERREEHAERLARAREHLETREGMRDWIRARVANPHLSPLNAALAGMQCPGAVLGTAAYWKKTGASIQRGEHGAAFITAPGFWPKPAFTAGQTNGAGELEELERELGRPPASLVEELRAIYVAAVAELGAKDAFARLLEVAPDPADIELEEDSTPARSDAIPF
jgi:hypothetical protein